MRLVERDMKRGADTTVGRWKGGRLHEIAYDSPEEILGVAREYAEYREDWAGASFAEVRRWADQGSERLRDSMLAKVDAIKLPDDYVRPELLKRRRRTRGDSGNELDIHRVYQGRLDTAWDRTVTEHVKTVGNRLVHIVIDLSANVMISHDAGLWRGACALRIYDALVKMGKSTAISVYFAAHRAWANSQYSTDGMVSVRVKNYGEPIREERLAAFSSMQFLRTAIFGAQRACVLRAPPGHGAPMSNYEIVTAAAEEDMEHGGAVVKIGQAFNREMAQRTIDKFIATYVQADAEVEGFSTEEQLHHG